MLKRFLPILILSIVFLDNLQAQNIYDIVARTLVRPDGSGTNTYKAGEFITLRGMNGFESRVYAAGPEDAAAGIQRTSGPCRQR